MAIAKLTSFLEDTLAERIVMHAVLMDILGLGVLIVGESGIGKSECALDLIVRGHRLVADDTVEIRRRAETILIGTCPELTRHHMELRGLGLINVKDLFGIASTRSSKRVELVVQLERWDPAREYERLGLDDDFYEILGLRVPLIRMPVAPGRSIAILVEVAARNQLLRSRGHHAARRSPTGSNGPCARRASRRPTRKTRSSSREARGERRKKQAGASANGGSPPDSPSSCSPACPGSGKSQAIRALEDLGYFCVDNLPTTLIPTLAKLSLRAGGDIDKVAIVVDVREGNFLSQFPKIFSRLRKMPRLNPVLIFLEASDTALVRRFSETRRPHPLAPDRSVSEGIREERARLNAIRDMSDEIVDTSDMTVHELRQFFMGVSRDRSRARLVVTLLSFGLQVRRAGRRGSRVRRAVPAEPAFRAGAAPAHRTRSGGGGLHGKGRADARVHGSARGLPPLRPAALRRGGQELSDRGDRMHRRPPSLGDDRRAAAPGAGRGRRGARPRPAPRHRRRRVDFFSPS